MTAASKPARTVASPRYHSRLGIVVARELRGFFLDSKIGWFLVAFAILIVPYALYMMHDVGALSPQNVDQDLRRSFAEHLLPLGIGPILLSSIWSNQDAAMREPLLVTAAKRHDLVFGRLLAAVVAWFGISLLAALELALLPQVPGLVSWRPFLGYFHPDLAFVVRLTLAWTVCGCGTFALFAYAPNIPEPSPHQYLWVIFLIPTVVALLKLPENVYLSALIPMANTMSGVNAAFAQLPLDPRVHSRTPPLALGWNAPHLWLITVVGASISAVVLSILTVRSLDRGEILSNTAKRIREPLFDRVNRFFGG
jgi:hypothetical protein